MLSLRFRVFPTPVRIPDLCLLPRTARSEPVPASPLSSVSNSFPLARPSKQSGQGCSIFTASVLRTPGSSTVTHCKSTVWTPDNIEPPARRKRLMATPQFLSALIHCSKAGHSQNKLYFLQNQQTFPPTPNSSAMSWPYGNHSTIHSSRHRPTHGSR